MADIEKISVGGTSYDVRDALAAHTLSDIAVAGSNITFEPLQYNDITITGSVILNDGIASNFTASNYIDFKDSTRYTTGTTTYYLKVKTPSSGSIQGDILQWNRWANLEFWSGSGLNAWNWGSDSSVNLLADSQVQSNTEYYFKIDVDYENKTKTYSYSLDGTAYTQLASFTDTGMETSSSNPLRLGNSSSSPSSDGAFTGSIDLGGCCIERSGVEIARGYYANAKTSINTTVDQTYNASSANAQSGVAINGAGFLKNTATGSNSLSILGNASVHSQSVNIGANSQADNYSTALGYNAQTRYNYGVAVGYGAYASGNAVCIGYPTTTINGRKGACNTNTIAIGQSTAGGSESIAIGVATIYGSSSIAIGRASTGSGANYAIQLGYGNNSTSNTFSVGLGAQASQNYRLLNSNGMIPGERIALQGTEAPTTSTAGSVGQFYVDTTNQIGYMCVSAADSTYVWKQITA